MIEIIKNLPEHVIGFRATGKVDKEDYEKILIPIVDNEAKKFGQLNFLLVLDTDVSNYSIGAWIDDALIGVKHLTQWHKIAIVSSQKAVVTLTDTLGHLIPGKSKGFLLTDLEDAIKW